MKPVDPALIQELWNQKLSDLQIARKLGCSVSVVCVWRKKSGLAPHHMTERMTDEQKKTAIALASAGKTVQEIAAETGVFVETIRKLLLRTKTPFVRAKRRTSAKEVHGTIGYGGYVEILVELDGPYGHLAFVRGGRRGYAPLHRMRMEDKLGRHLLPGEVVHHLDGDVYNNSLDNLAVFSSNRQHLDHHLETGVRRCKVAARL